MTLARWPRGETSPLPPFTIGWWTPEDLEERRQVRISAALDKKLDKLNDACTGTTKGVLVLESDDIALGNAIDVQVALRCEADSRDVLPDWIALWERIGDTTFVWILRENGEWIDEPEWLEWPTL